MSLSDLQQRLLGHVTNEPSTATEIWRRFYGLPDGRITMSRSMKRSRRATAKLLEELADRGHIEETEVERHGAPLPAYRRA